MAERRHYVRSTGRRSRTSSTEAKAMAITIMLKAAEGAIMGKLTTDEPNENDAKSWSLHGTWSLRPRQGSKKPEAKVSMPISTWRWKSIKMTPAGTAVWPIASADKIDVGDVETVAEGCRQPAMGSATKYMETDDALSPGASGQSHLARRKRHHMKAQAPAMIASAAG